MFSERVSTHFTGRPSSSASLAATTPSADRCLAPKEPPTFGAITRTRSGSMPNSPERTPRTMCGIWQARCTVRSKSVPVGSTAMALPSMGTTATRWFSKRPRTTTSAPASGSSLPARNPMMTLLPIDSNWSGRIGCECILHVDDGPERLVVDLHQLGGVHGQGSRLGHDDDDGVADEVDGALRERRADRGGMQHHQARERSGKSRSSALYDADDSRHLSGGLDVDRPDRCVGDRRAHEVQREHALDLQVVDVGPRPPEKVGVFDPPYGLARECPGAKWSCGGLLECSANQHGREVPAVLRGRIDVTRRIGPLVGRPRQRPRRTHRCAPPLRPPSPAVGWIPC